MKNTFLILIFILSIFFKNNLIYSVGIDPVVNEEFITDSTSTDISISDQENTQIEREEIKYLNPENIKKGKEAMCFDYYTFNGVKTMFQTDRSQYEKADVVIVRGSLINENKYPLTNVTVRARVVKNIPNPVYLRSEIITLDEFDVIKDISLKALENKPINTSYVLPTSAVSGEYKILFFVYNHDRFNHAGLSFTNDITSGRVSFDVKGDKDQYVYLDQTRITVNDQPHNVMAFMTNHATDTVRVQIPLVNPKNINESVDVKYELYSWDGILDKNKIEENTTNKNIKPSSEELLTFDVNTTKHPVYFIRITATNSKGQKTISNIRFTVDGYNHVRINSVGVNAYPILKNTQATLFTCFHNGTSQTTETDYTIETRLYDMKDRLVSESLYVGPIMGNILAIKNDFISKRDLFSYKIKTRILDDKNQIVDEIESVYKCEDINPDGCPKSNNLVKNIIYIVGILLILLLIFLIIKKIIRRRKDNNQNNTMMQTPFKTILFGLMLGTVALWGVESKAVVSATPFEVKIECINKCAGYFEVYNMRGNMFGSIQTSFNLMGPNFTSMPQDFKLNKDESVFGLGVTSGDWFLSAEAYDSPPMDGVLYNLNNALGKITASDGQSIVKIEDLINLLKDRKSKNQQIRGVLTNSRGGIYTATTTVDNFIKNAPLIQNGFSKDAMSVRLYNSKSGSQSRPYRFVSFNPEIIECSSTDNGCVAKKPGKTKIIIFPETHTPSPDERIVCREENVKGVLVDMCDKFAGTQKTRYYGYIDVDGSMTGKRGDYVPFPYYNSGFTIVSHKTMPGGYIGGKQGSTIDLNKSTDVLVQEFDSRIEKSPAVTLTKSYTIPPITYTVTVPEIAGTPHVVAYDKADEITQNSAKIHWTYSDIDNDSQTNYQVQIATDENFSNIISNTAFTSPISSPENIRNITVSNLTPNTLYYVRVRAYNNTDFWSNWSSGSFRTSSDNQNLTQTCSCQNRDYVCTGGSGNTTQVNSPQCALSSYCTSQIVGGNNIAYTVTPIRRLGNISYNYDNNTVTPNSSNNSYIVPNNISTISVLLTDLFDNQTHTAICNLDTSNTTTTIPTVNTPLIEILKNPRFTVNKGGACTINWTIQNMPPGTNCVITSVGTNTNISGSGYINLTGSSTSGSVIVPQLNSNQRIIISCTNEGSTISESAICRINPEIREQ